jgi:hypothetical protein
LPLIRGNAVQDAHHAFPCRMDVHRRTDTPVLENNFAFVGNDQSRGIE